MCVFMRLHFHPRMRAGCIVQLQAVSATLYLLFCCVISLNLCKTSSKTLAKSNLELHI